MERLDQTVTESDCARITFHPESVDSNQQVSASCQFVVHQCDIDGLTLKHC